MRISDIVDIGVSGLLAQRARMGVTASNLANAQTTRTAEGGPYQRRDPVFRAEPLRTGFADRIDRHVQRVRVERIVPDDSEPIRRFEPSHPDANEEGYVLLPNIKPVEELANLLSAQRSFEANLLILRKAREIGEAAMRIGR